LIKIGGRIQTNKDNINLCNSLKVNKLRYVAGLAFVSMIWGATFPLVKESLKYITPMGFISLRFFIASSILLAFYFRNISKNRQVVKASLLLGFFLFLGYAFQTVGLRYTTSSNAGFITGLYVVFTPIFSYFLVGERITKRIGFALVVSVTGLYFLSGATGFNFGDALELLCAIAYGIHVALIGKFTRDFDSPTLTILQLFFVFLFSSFFWGADGFYMEYSPVMIFGVIFTGIFASAMGILIQVRAQRYISPSRAAIIFTTEPVFAGIFSYIFLGEGMSLTGLVGAILILSAMLLSAFEGENQESSWLCPGE